MAEEKRKPRTITIMPGLIKSSLYPWVIKARNNPERVMFVLHRVTGVIIILYLMAHVIVTSLSLNEALWTQTMSAFAGSIANKIGEWIVAGAVFFHGLNGIRLLLVEFFGLGVGRPERPKPPYIPPSLRSGQRIGIYIVAILALIGWILSGILIFTDKLILP
ncbi:MAG: succinate dehydrogenase, cytochrome b556 subunit [Pyrodictiaceae archaeon]